MRSSPKIVMFYALFFICIMHVKAQYTTGDFIPSTLISEGISAPGRMAIDSDDNVYVTDAILKNIVKYDGQGNYLSTISTDFNPISIAINKNDQLFVGDKETGNIYKLQANGNKTLFYTGATLPNSMVFGFDVLYFTDSKQNKVLGLDVSGNIVTDFTYETFVFPTGIAFDPYNKYILVAEHGGIGEDMDCGGGCSMCWSSWGPQTSIYMFNLDGSHVSTFGCFGKDDGLFQRIQGISVGPCGNYYAVDPYLGRVSVFDNYGTYITNFGLQGDGTGEFNLPMDIVFTSDNRAFVSSMNKGEIDVFSIAETLPTATITSADQTVCSLEDAIVEVQLTGTAPWTFTYTINDLIQETIDTANLTADTSISNFNLPVSEEGLYEITSITDSTTTPGSCLTGATNILVSDAPPTATILTTSISKCSDDASGVEVQFTGIAPWTFTYTVGGLNPVEITTTENPYTITADQSGVYEITELTDDGCSGTVSPGNVTVTVHPLPTATITNEHTQLKINPGEYADIEIAFTGTAPFTFQYVITETNLTSVTTYDNPYTLTVSEIGAYEIMAVADLHCSNNEWQDWIGLILNDIQLPTATMITESLEFCLDDSGDIIIGFTGVAPWTFSYTIDGLNPIEISTSDNPFLLSASSTGDYALSAVSDINGAGTFSGHAIVNSYPLPTADFFYDVNRTEVQFISNATNAETHFWEFGDGNSSIDANPIHNYKKKENYTVTYTAISANCGAVQTSKTFKVGTNEDTDVIVIYPNPSHGEFTLKISPVEEIISDIRILITSLSGQIIFSDSFAPTEVTSFDGSYYIYINLYNFTKGIYVLSVQTDTLYAQEKLVLKD